MIFVTVGSGKFEKLVQVVDKIAPRIKEKIVIQIGNGNYEPKNCQFFRFKTSLEPYYKKARLIVAHGGAGTTFELLKKGKKLISVANLDRTDVHQEEILEALSKERYLIWCRNLDQLGQRIKKALRFKFKKYKQPKCEIAKEIGKFLTRI